VCSLLLPPEASLFLSAGRGERGVRGNRGEVAAAGTTGKAHESRAMSAPFLYHRRTGNGSTEDELIKAALEGNLGRHKGIVASLGKRNGDRAAFFLFKRVAWGCCTSRRLRAIWRSASTWWRNLGVMQI
ncbi:unnamed protein product, partial [Urochloa humidicola]